MSYNHHYNRGYNHGYRYNSRPRYNDGYKKWGHNDKNPSGYSSENQNGPGPGSGPGNGVATPSGAVTSSNGTGSIPLGPRGVVGSIKEKTYDGTNPSTGINKFDLKFPRLNHHQDYQNNKFSYPRSIDCKKNYKVFINHDDENDKKTKKIRFNGEKLLGVVDPRMSNVVHYFQKPNKQSKKFPFKQLPQTRFQYDKDSLGPPPQTELVVWDLPPTTHEVYLTNYFKSLSGSSIKDIKFTNDPKYAVPLGIVSFKFHGSIEKAEKLAKQLISTIKTQKPKIDGVPLKIDLNDQDDKFLNSKIDIAREKLRISRNIREEQEKKLRREIEEKRKIEEKKRLLEEKKKLQEKNRELSRDLYKFKPNSTILSTRHNNKIIPGVILPDDLVKYVKDRPYILIHDKYASTKKIASLDIKRALNKYDWTRIIPDKTGFYIVFNSLKEAERCFINEDGAKFYEYRLFMELAVPKGFENNKSDEEDLFSSKSTTNHDIIDEAANMLIKEFQSFLSKDIRERIIAPTVLDLLSHDKYPELIEELKAKELENKTVQPVVTSNNQLKQEALYKITKKKQQSLHEALPSFKKKAEVIQKHKKSLVPMQHALNYDRDSDEDDEDESISRSLTPIASSVKREYTSAGTSVEPEDEPKTKKQKTGLRKSFLYDTSSDEEMENEEIEVSVGHKLVKKRDLEINEQISSGQEVGIGGAEEEEKEEEEKEEQEQEQEEKDDDDDEIDYSKSEVRYQPTIGGPKPVYQEARLLPSDVFNLDAFQNIIKDEEDLKYAKQVLEEESIKTREISTNIEYWAWKQKDVSHGSQEIVEDVELIGTLKPSLQNSSGSFKSEGYHKISEKDKIDYLPHRRKVHKPLKTIQHEDEEEDITSNTNSSLNVTTSTNNVQSSRVNRANNRRFAADITAQLGNETEVLSLNALTKRKKPVSFARSSIHNWGLYALEPIAAKEMIIEYVGEQIRQQVAEHREKSYLKTGIGSSYLFRIDENTVIDATKKGGIARFINHCCNPSCTAKIIKVEGTKRIVIYALRDIDSNEELTYDYKFEREINDDERIPCLCGAPGCKGYLN